MCWQHFLGAESVRNDQSLKPSVDISSEIGKEFYSMSSKMFLKFL